MRTSKSPEEFFHAMKKKPALQKILDNIGDYTDQELENIPGQPKWIRDQLVKYKNRNGQSTGATAEAIATQMMMASPPPQQPIMYDVYQWQADTWKMPCGHSGGMTLDVEHGDYLMHHYQNNRHWVYLSSSRGILNDHQWQWFCSQAKYIDTMDRTSYFQYISSANEHKSPVRINQPANNELFRIIRH